MLEWLYFFLESFEFQRIHRRKVIKCTDWNGFRSIILIICFLKVIHCRKRSKCLDTGLNPYCVTYDSKRLACQRSELHVVTLLHIYMKVLSLLAINKGWVYLWKKVTYTLYHEINKESQQVVTSLTLRDLLCKQSIWYINLCDPILKNIWKTLC